MAADVKQVAEQGFKLWRGLSLKRRIAAIGVLLAFASGLSYILLSEPSENYRVLFSGLSQTDAAEVVAELRSEKVPYRLRGQGSVIEVPASRADDLRLQLASNGLPKGGGVGYELFDKQTFGTSSFVEKMNYRRALAGELSRSISSLDAVSRARVHIAIPEKTIFKNARAEPSASVAIRLEKGRALSEGQIRGVVHLVASSIEKLKPDRITLVDEGGAVLWAGGERGDVHQKGLEDKLKKRVEAILERVVGAGHSEVVVTAEMDESRTERTEEVYENEKPVLRSESVSEETRVGVVRTGGLAGTVDKPADVTPTGPPNLSKVPQPKRMSATKNYEINRVFSRVMGPEVQVRRIHVAVLINGALFASTSSGAIAANSEVRSAPQADLTRLSALIREAAGLDLDRGDRLEIHTIPFVAKDAILAEEPPPPETSLLAGLPPWAVPVFAVGLVFTCVLGAFLLLRRHGPSKELLAEPMRAGDLEAALSGDGTAKKGDAKPEPTLRELVEAAAKESPELAAQILTAWIGTEAEEESLAA